MMDLARHFPLLIEDEFELLARLVPLRGADGAGSAPHVQQGARFIRPLRVDLLARA